MGLSKDAKGANWKRENLIFFIDDELSIQGNSIRAVERLRYLYNWNAKIRKIYYYKEKNEALENNAAFFAKSCGLFGVGVAALAIMCPAASPLAVAARIAVAVPGGGMTGTGTIAALTTDCYAFHVFLVFECSGGMWVSLEKNDERVCIQIGRNRDDVIRFKNGGSYNHNQDNRRGETTELATRDAGQGFFIEDIIKWVVNTKQHENQYHIFTANCKHIAQDANNRFSASSEPLPGYVDLLVKSKGVKRE